MKERTEEQIFSKSPIKVMLGSKNYDLKPLPLMKAQAWRSMLLTAMKAVVGDMSAEQNLTSFGPALAASLVAFPDKVADLVFAWSSFEFELDPQTKDIIGVKFNPQACELPKTEIMTEATDEQLAEAYKAIMVVAYPFLAPLVLSMKVTKSQLS